MKINVSFKNQDLVRLDSSSRNAIFQINWEQDGVSYPDKLWSDFGVVVLCVWIETIIELLEGSQELEFTFMDGPHFLRVEYYDKNTRMLKLSLHGINTTWHIPLSIVIEEIRKAVGKTYEELKKRDIREEDRNALKKGNLILEKCLLEVKL